MAENPTRTGFERHTQPGCSSHDPLLHRCPGACLRPGRRSDLRRARMSKLISRRVPVRVLRCMRSRWRRSAFVQLASRSAVRTNCFLNSRTALAYGILARYICHTNASSAALAGYDCFQTFFGAYCPNLRSSNRCYVAVPTRVRCARNVGYSPWPSRSHPVTLMCMDLRY